MATKRVKKWSASLVSKEMNNEITEIPCPSSLIGEVKKYGVRQDCVVARTEQPSPAGENVNWSITF